MWFLLELMNYALSEFVVSKHLLIARTDRLKYGSVGVWTVESDHVQRTFSHPKFLYKFPGYIFCIL